MKRVTLLMGLVVVAGVLAFALGRCDETRNAGSRYVVSLDSLRRANETSALAQLKKYSTAQAVLLMEEGRYAHRLSELYEDGRFAGIIDRRLQDAWHRSEAPVPLSGYLFADIEQDERGHPLTDPLRSGLSAYPVEPGVSGDRVLLILLDEQFAQTSPGFVGGGSWRLFWARYEEVGSPVTRWPSKQELQSTYREIRKRTPREGLREAQELMGDYKSGRRARDPVFGR